MTAIWKTFKVSHKALDKTNLRLIIAHIAIFHNINIKKLFYKIIKISQSYYKVLLFDKNY